MIRILQDEGFVNSKNELLFSMNIFILPEKVGDFFLTVTYIRCIK